MEGKNGVTKMEDEEKNHKNNKKEQKGAKLKLKKQKKKLKKRKKKEKKTRSKICTNRIETKLNYEKNDEKKIKVNESRKINERKY